MRVPVILLLFVGLAIAYECPKNGRLPESCSCKETEHGLDVHCHTSQISPIFKALENKTIDILRIDRCTDGIASIEDAPVILVRNLTIQRCTFETISESVFERLGSRLRVLNMERNTFKKFPKFGRLPILDKLEIGHNDLSNISSSTFAQLPRLKTLRMNYGNLRFFPTLALLPLSGSLKTLDVSHNMFCDISAILLPAFNLHLLDLSFNLIASVKIPGFWQMTSLHELRLNNNMITHLMTTTSDMTPKLKTLNLNDNLISHISDDFFKGVKTVERLELSSNSIIQLPNISTLSNLEYLNLDSNKIDSLGEGSFNGNPKLAIITIRNNRLSHISNSTFPIGNGITMLFINNNSISTIEKGAFGTLPHLVELGLSSNNHIEIKNVTDPAMQKLLKLDLNSNRLQALNKNDFAGLVKLEYLDVRNTGLETIENGTLTETMGTVLISGNHLQCDERLEWFFKHVVKNNIKTFNDDKENIICKAGNKLVEIRLSKFFTNLAEKIMFDLFVAVTESEKDETGCKTVKAHVEVANQWITRVCEKP
uniref:LRRCT domain-containing protein n=1 Tax=Panagrellus redivivus TaxID=6233 RepID=A0A7E4W854_PANRE